MANYKTTPEIVQIVYGLLSSITVPKYPFTKPSLCDDDEFLVINSLPIDANVMQRCYFNVNYYCKDIDAGAGNGYVPDMVKLNTGVALVLAILKKVSTDIYLIDFESQDITREEQLHFINLRFSFKYINN